MTAPDQTNAEVSDERLRELLPCPFCGASLEALPSISFPSRTQYRHPAPSIEASRCPMASFVVYSNWDEIIAAWNRRSVTSQASEGEVETAFIKLCEALGIPATAAAYLEVASPSKRVERLETSGTALLELLDDYMTVSSITANDRYRVALEEFRQALQGGRS